MEQRISGKRKEACKKGKDRYPAQGKGLALLPTAWKPMQINYHLSLSPLSDSSMKKVFLGV